MASKRAGLPSLNSISRKEGLQPVKVQRYRAGKAPEGYVDPALESSDEEDEAGTSARGGRTGINVAIAQEEKPRMAYQVLNIEKMTRERQAEKALRGQSEVQGAAAAAVTDRRLARLQAMQMEDRRSRGDIRSRQRDESDEDEEEEAEEDEDEEEDALRRRKAARARAMREQDEEEELWGKGEEEEEEGDTGRRGKARRESEESEGSSEYTSGSEEESSEDDAPRRKLMKPVFVPKSQRITIDESANSDAAYELAEKARLEAIEERKKESHQMLKEYVARQANVEEVPDVDSLAEVDDTDGLDEEAEFEQWKLRELKRIKRDREELEAREAEKAEIERRREMTEEERVKEDMEYLAKKAKEEKAMKAAGTVEKYHHKGAFFMDTGEAILKRSTAEPTPDAVKDIKALPKVMQVRNFGRAGQTKYTTLKEQDTSQRSGWTDPISRNLAQRHRMGGFRGEDYKIASKMSGRDRGRGGRGGRGNGSGRDNANHTQLGDRYPSSSSSGRYDKDRYDGGSRDYHDRDRPIDRDRVRDDRDDRDRRSSRDHGDRHSGRSSSSYRDRDRARGRDRDDEGESSKRRRH
ncbi:splicing factor, Prp19-binding domain-containing protein [Gamsiella multidivaricata]|uniref:splicing factor, Prp19-binding domain-containing protein n=1 Tax=Gamsiella multidivaricata TaxID=101098 RepID=UPI00221ECA03|nr:splicing factor, Prp19-binding domain-containing protein [Gamsiella multidivaricata]KAI7820807.1 splicing factor, Prp19-binding domain-containing protein [Gamsiella multidivaricata]